MPSRPRTPLGRLSLRVKLPLAAAALILLVGAALSGASYFAARRTLLESAGERLENLRSQFIETFRTSLTQTRSRAATMAQQPALAAYLRSPAPALQPAATAALKYQGPQPELSVVMELRDADGRVLLSDRRPGPGASDVLPSLGETDAAPLTRSFPELARGDSAVIGRLREYGDSILYPVVARVPGQPGGFLVNWRRVSNAPQAREQIARLLGSEAAFHFGNLDGSLWSDLGRPTAGPPLAADQLNGLVRFTRPAPLGEVLAAAAPIPGSPWAFTIEFPTRAILSPARSFLRLLGGIAVLFMSLGVAGAWLLSRRMSDPLRYLTGAADAIAAGDFSRRVELTRSDELGKLAASFNTMAVQVGDAQQRLEETVAARTRELNQTLQQLQDTQDSLLRREKLAMLGQLASGVGHELRNPLGVISNAIYYLEAIQPDAPPEVREYLGMVRTQVRLSTKIVNDLLEFSHTPSVHRQPVSLASIVKPQLERLSAEQVRLEYELPESLPPVHVDPVHIGQVVHNLLNNAVQAMGAAGGTLRVRAVGNGTGCLRLEIADSGPGIPPDHLDRVFEPLFTTKARGIGLGLAVSRTLAQANGGDLGVQSVLGEGATFTLTLPLVPGSA